MSMCVLIYLYLIVVDKRFHDSIVKTSNLINICTLSQAFLNKNRVFGRFLLSKPYRVYLSQDYFVSQTVIRDVRGAMLRGVTYATDAPITKMV